MRPVLLRQGPPERERGRPSSSRPALPTRSCPTHTGVGPPPQSPRELRAMAPPRPQQGPACAGRALRASRGPVGSDGEFSDPRGFLEVFLFQNYTFHSAIISHLQKMAEIIQIMSKGPPHLPTSQLRPAQGRDQGGWGAGAPPGPPSPTSSCPFCPHHVRGHLLSVEWEARPLREPWGGGGRVPSGLPVVPQPPLTALPRCPRRSSSSSR